jgi:hypothetical protein
MFSASNYPKTWCFVQKKFVVVVLCNKILDCWCYLQFCQTHEKVVGNAAESRRGKVKRHLLIRTQDTAQLGHMEDGINS